MSTPTALNRRIAGALTISALALGGTLAAGALSPAAAVSPIPTGSITGTVVGPDGAPIPNAGVEISRYDSVDDDWNYWDEGSTGLAGDYAFTRLTPGSYQIWISADGFIGEYYNDAPSSATAIAVTVGAGNSAAATVALAAAAPSVSLDSDSDLTGVVTDSATGKPITGINVYAYDATTNSYLDDAWTDTAGRYEIDDLDGHASVKISFSDDSFGGADLRYLTSWSGGAKMQSAASAVALTPGAPVIGSAALTRSAGITGRVLNPAGAAPIYGYVSVYDADSSYENDASIRPDGTYYLGGLNPGEEYRVVFGGAYDYPGNDYDADATYYFDQWFTDGNNFASATPVTLGAGGSWTPNIGATLRDTLVALETPSVSGDFMIGKTLTGNKGRWNRNGNSTFGYEWLRGATVVGTASTYTLTGADAGQSIALRVTITNFDHNKTRTLSATTAATVAKYTSAVSAKGKKVKKGKKAGATKVTVSVKAGSQPASRTTGTVKVTEGKKKVATVKIKNGKGSFLVTKAGKHKYTLTYSGNASTRGDGGKATVKVAKAKKGKKKK